MSECVLYVVRHGQSQHNRDGIVSGHVDPQLTEEGERQALETKRKLAHIKFDTAYSSDLQRAVRTAEIICGRPVPESHRLPQLRERNFGSYDGGPTYVLRELRQAQAGAYQALSAEQRWKYKNAPDIESDFEVAARFVTALEDIATHNMGKTILVASHGGALRTMLLKLGYLTEEELPPGSIKNAGYVHLVFGDGEFMIESADVVDVP